MLPAHPLRRARFISSVLALVALSCGGGTARPPSLEQSPEAAWLADIGTGAEQNEQVCARGARDRVALALCAPHVAIQSLDDLYRALGLGPSDARRLAATTHSLSLSGRGVSAANPRVMVFTDTNAPGRFQYEDIVATAFARGQQLVELVGLDHVPIVPRGCDTQGLHSRESSEESGDSFDPFLSVVSPSIERV